MEEEHGLTDRSTREGDNHDNGVEDKALKQIFIRTGFGMLVALLAAVFVFR